MASIHHNTKKSILNSGAEINEYSDNEFVLVNNSLGLRAVSEDARFLRKLASEWAAGKNTEDYYVEDQVDSVEDDEAEATQSGSVVKGAYKERYREAGHPPNCGDWLAQHLESLTHDEDGKFVLESFTEIAEMNGINHWGRYLNGSSGQNGLMRMTVSNLLRTVVKKTGVLKTPKGDLKFEG